MKTLILTLLLLIQLKVHSQTLYYNTCEDTVNIFRVPPAASLEKGSWSYAVQAEDSIGDGSADTVYLGAQSARFEVRTTEALVKDGHRAEIVIIKPVPREAWYSYAVYFPTSGYAYDTQRDCISQWYQNGSPSFSIRTKKGAIYFEYGNNKDALKRGDVGVGGREQPIVKDVWHKIVIHVIHSYDTDGLIEFWYDGVKTVKKGPNMYKLFDGSKPLYPKLKIGMYKNSFDEDNNTTATIRKRIIFFDNIKVGNAKMSYAQMVP